MVLTQLQVLSTHADWSHCELIKVAPPMNLDSLPLCFRHGNILSHKKGARIQSKLLYEDQKNEFLSLRQKGKHEWDEIVTSHRQLNVTCLRAAGDGKGAVGVSLLQSLALD